MIISDLKGLPVEQPENISSQPTTKTETSRVGTVWLTLTVFVLLLVLLIIFILQNSVTVHLHYLGAKVSLQFGVAMLIATVAGALLTLLIGSARIIQLKSRRRHEL